MDQVLIETPKEKRGLVEMADDLAGFALVLFGIFVAGLIVGGALVYGLSEKRTSGLWADLGRAISEERTAARELRGKLEAAETQLRRARDASTRAELLATQLEAKRDEPEELGAVR